MVHTLYLTVLLMRSVSADINPLWSVILSMTLYHKIILV